MSENSHSLSCYIEAPRFVGSEIKADLHADFYEGAGGEKPTNIIRCDQTACVEVTIDFGGCELARLLCLKWCVKVAFEGCGSALEGSLPVKWVEQRVCESKVVKVKIDIPANYFPCNEAECGDVYMLCVSVLASDTCGNPAPFAGYCKGGSIMVYPSSRR